jgi:hypothetical protein
MLVGAGIALSLGMLAGCAELLEQTHVAATDNEAFFPFVRASVILSRDEKKVSDAVLPGASDRRSDRSLRQGNVALDFDLSHVGGKDNDPAGDRTFDLNVYSLAVRGSTRPGWLGGIYLEGLAGFHLVALDSKSSRGMDITADEGGFLMGFGIGYAFTENATVHMRSSAGSTTAGALAMREILATYWFTPRLGLSAGYRSWEYFNEIGIVGFDFHWRGPAAGLVVAF